MTKAQFALRIGICIMIVGISIILAMVTLQGYSGVQGAEQFTISPNGTFATLVAPLSDGPHEIRVTAPKSFNATLYIFAYEGIRKLLAEGTKEPLIQEDILGSTLVDFNMTRRGAYLVIIESHTSSEATGTVGIVEKAISNQDIIWDAAIILATGIATTIVAFISKKLSRRTP